MHSTFPFLQFAPPCPRRGHICVWAFGFALAASALTSPLLAQVAQPFEEETADGLDTAAPVEAPNGEMPADAPTTDAPPVDVPTTDTPPADAPQQRRLLVLDTDYINLETLGSMLRVQAPDWEFVPQNGEPSFLRIDRMLEELGPHEALLWFETGNSMIRIAVIGHDGVSHVSLLPQSEGSAESTAPDGESPEPATHPAETNSTRSVALVVAALLSEMEQEQRQFSRDDAAAAEDYADADNYPDDADPGELQRAQRSRDALAERVRLLEEQLENQPPRPSRWPSPIKPDGWFFRFGWVNGFSPQHQFGYGSPYVYAYPTGGIRVAAGRHFRGIFSVGASVVTLHAFDIWNGSVSAFASVHTPHRFRVGIGLEVGVLVATESDQYAGTSFGWVSPRFYIPVEFAGIFTRKGGISVKCGPTILSTPVGGFVGYDLSVEWEFD